MAEHAAPHSAALNMSEISVGQQLPPVRVPMTATSIMATALATRDYQPVHHDLERARALGSASVFTNTHTTAGWLERLALQWAGPGAFLRSIRLKLGLPNHPGDELVLSGTVVSRDEAAGRVAIAAVGSNARGDHVTADLVVELAKASHA